MIIEESKFALGLRGQALRCTSSSQESGESAPKKEVSVAESVSSTIWGIYMFPYRIYRTESLQFWGLMNSATEKCVCKSELCRIWATATASKLACCRIVLYRCFPRGSIYTTIMELGAQNYNRDGLLGPNSIMVVFMDPLGFRT